MTHMPPPRGASTKSRSRQRAKVGSSYSHHQLVRWLVARASRAHVYSAAMAAATTIGPWLTGSTRHCLSLVGRQASGRLLPNRGQGESDGYYEQAVWDECA